ncbi:chemotaxis protein CheB [Flavihumibacter petaseus]|uniref:protein-glutamate methylesterase n=1 Tax=Flavihumibacter petaseus NBRC 106054 TaxID=1220578 RepID=A0A0E9MWD4_9BACT|nr:chemotaxis protein CheB [Flavihumibacter petaseus]GAO41879.1 putative chemotaxis protein-glutamate methylesterase [Flavihumibacter petaseus NBRC 106054]
MEKNQVSRFRLALIGGSAGGLDAILKIMSRLQQVPSYPIVIVLHRKADYDTLLVDLLENRTVIPVREAEEKITIENGYLYVAPADFHLLFESDGTFALDASEKVNYSRPSIDVSFISAAEVYRENLLCILLSGANADGTAGMKTARELGATCIVQAPQSAEVPFMPESALKEMEVDLVLAAESIGDFMARL